MASVKEEREKTEREKLLLRLMDAASAANLALVRELIALGANPKQAYGERRKTALMSAAQSGSVECARELMGLSNPLAKDSMGNNAAFYAVYSDNPEAVALLLTVSNPKLKSATGETMLMRAASRGREEMVDYLLPLSDPAAKDERGWTAADYAESRLGKGCELASRIQAAALSQGEARALAKQVPQGQTMPSVSVKARRAI